MKRKTWQVVQCGEVQPSIAREGSRRGRESTEVEEHRGGEGKDESKEKIKKGTMKCSR